MKVAFLILSLSITMLEACTPLRAHKDYEQESVNLPGQWRLVELYGNSEVDTTRMKVPAYILITAGNNKITGSSGCNRFYCTYAVNGDQIKFGLIASTKIYCEGVPENELYAAFGQVEAFKIEEGNVLSFYAGEKRILRFLRFTGKL